MWITHCLCGARMVVGPREGSRPVTVDTPIRATREDRFLEHLAALALIAPSPELVRDVLTLHDDEPVAAEVPDTSVMEDTASAPSR
jgi:hypothetical protein